MNKPIIKSSSWLLALLGVFFFLPLCGQQKLKIEDPTRTLELSYPDGWKHKDDGYNLILYPKGKKNKQYLDITYFSYDQRVAPDSLFWIQTELVFPQRFKNYELINQEKISLDSKVVRHAQFTTQNFWRTRLVDYYQFIASESEFQIFYFENKTGKPSSKKQVMEIINSIQLTKNKRDLRK